MKTIPSRTNRIMLLCLGLFLCGVVEGATISFGYAMSALSSLDIRSEVKVSSKRVTLLDLFDSTGIPQDWKSAMAGTDIGETPAMGTEKVIYPAQLKAFVDQFIAARGTDASSVQVTMPERITVRRQAMGLSKEEVEQIYRDFVLRNAPWNPSDVTIKSIYFNGWPIDLPAGTMTYEVTAAPKERYIGNVALTLQFAVNGERDKSLRVTGKVEVFQNVVHTVRSLKRNDIVASTDVELQRISISDTPDRYAMSLDSIVGKRVLRDVGMRQPISVGDLDTPVAVKKGTPVTIVYSRHPGLKLTAKGQSKEDGNIGGTVRVVNLSTNKIIFCRIIDGTTVQATD